jgi:uncharacterized protein (DUF1800 family)
MLGASAHSPAMMIYLDNARSSVEYSIGANGGNKRRQQREQRLRRQTASQNTPGEKNLNNVMSLNAMPLVMSDMATASMEMSPEQAATTQAIVPKKVRGGINENYARELMELHTLGVNGGYTQKDVQEVARCFTGWSVDQQTGEFRFFPNRHDKGAKTVLGQKIPAGGGIEDGERVLDILARHPSTARFLSRKLCMRLVSDTPPAALVERAAQTFLRTEGDLRQVTRTIVTSPEFFAASNYRSKIKSPFEYAVSAARALNATFNPLDVEVHAERMTLVGAGTVAVRPNNTNGRAVVAANKTMARQIGIMGQPLYSFQAPTGYSENSQTWVSSGALVARLNFALDLANGRLSDVQLPSNNQTQQTMQDKPEAQLQRLIDTTLHGEISVATRKTIEAQHKTGVPLDVAKTTALLIGSPDFQRR